ncbi:ABC transporter, ATP-binding protein [Xenorhabdus bovienii str. kraussei Quebec]|uniref:ABC transporter, ATP-binding protein n=1 Tax=Xenorhabdus bovienii str. kraussei Quebec TaxID=1398203 RepID=A0A077P2R9_XENBV|nr:ATP-binding cassette domain-containing protein [Xenorhabdus bovienii]CDH18740.1 ABC transporter, ATP-binding protein [Xenorhabdus bovienii str. kraussei Quebec]
MIRAEDVSRIYHVHQRNESVRSALSSLWKRKYETVVALKNVNFQIEDGERVGILGPNGAGKTTLVKLLSGLLHPSSGLISVGGYTPYLREKAFLHSVGLVMGNKGQLIWDLPPIDTFEMIRVLFEIPLAVHRQTLNKLSELLQLHSIMTKPTRQLSLGERMRCEVAASLIHQPKVLFLDEPTIGLDVAMQAALRDFVAEYNRRHNATILLTSHYMEDVRVLCPRIIIVDHGAIFYDGDLRTFTAKQNPEKIISFSVSRQVNIADFSRFGTLISQTEERCQIRVHRDHVPRLVHFLVEQQLAVDLTIEDPPLEEILRQIFGHPNQNKTEQKQISE